MLNLKLLFFIINFYYNKIVINMKNNFTIIKNYKYAYL